MKRFLKFILPLVFIAVMAVPAWPAALTLSEINRGTLGPLRVQTGFATTASADTLAFPFKNVLYVGMVPRVAASTDDIPLVWYSISGTTITIYVSGDVSDGDATDVSVRIDYFIIGF